MSHHVVVESHRARSAPTATASQHTPAVTAQKAATTSPALAKSRRRPALSVLPHGSHLPSARRAETANRAGRAKTAKDTHVWHGSSCQGAAVSQAWSAKPASRKASQPAPSV